MRATVSTSFSLAKEVMLQVETVPSPRLSRGDIAATTMTLALESTHIVAAVGANRRHGFGPPAAGHPEFL